MMRPLTHSAEIRFEQGAQTFGIWIVKLVLGAIVFALGLKFLTAEYAIAAAAKEEPHLVHIAIFAGIAMFGLLIPFAPFMLPIAQKALTMAGPYIPGGRRAYDPAVAPIELPPRGSEKG